MRNTHLKVRNKLWYVNVAREEKNPYIQQVMAMEEEKKRSLGLENDDDGELEDLPRDESNESK